MTEYRDRIIEQSVEARLRSHGAVLITGPKTAGKTTTARSFAASTVRLDRDPAALKTAQANPDLILDGDNPRLIDEYQLAPGVWNAVRGRVDDLGEKGLFLLTGSATPEEDEARHTGAGRIAPLAMRTMTFFERGLSSGEVSVGGLLGGARQLGTMTRLDIAEVVEAMVVGGWPQNIGLAAIDAIDANNGYLDVIAEVDIREVDGVRRDPEGVRRLLASYARNVGTDASLRTIGRGSGESIGEPTLHDYVRALRRLFLIEDQPSWKPSLRSRVRLAATPKRHLADPSLVAAALGATPERLLGPEIQLTGFLFESQVVHDLRVYAQPHRGTVHFYRDNKGLEVDAVVERPDGRWIGVEVKLGHSWVEEGVETLLALRKKLSDEAKSACVGLMVVVADSPSYVRDDGVIVASIASLGP